MSDFLRQHFIVCRPGPAPDLSTMPEPCRTCGFCHAMRCEKQAMQTCKENGTCSLYKEIEW